MKHKQPEQRYPQTMQDVGTPQEMSPVKDISGLEVEPPIVELTQKEAWETTDSLSESEIREP